MARIVSITYQPEDVQYGERLDYFIRCPLTVAELLVGHGIAGDRKAARNPRRQVNLLSSAWLANARELGFDTTPGAFGEQLIIDQLNFDRLAPGTRLSFTGGATIEITGPRSGCQRLELAQGERSIAPIDPIGLLAKVTGSGLLRVGAAVQIVTVPEKR